MEVVITVDVLRRGGVQTVVAGFAVVDCSRGVKIGPDATLEDALKSGPYDIIIIPGGGHGAEELACSEKVGEILKAQEKAGRWIGAICAGPLVLDRHGIGKGTKCQQADGVILTTLTSHPSAQDRLEAGYRYRGKSRVCVSGKFITSQGPGTAFEFALAILELLTDKETVEKVKEPMIMPPKHPEECNCQIVDYL